MKIKIQISDECISCIFDDAVLHFCNEILKNDDAKKYEIHNNNINMLIHNINTHLINI